MLGGEPCRVMCRQLRREPVAPLPEVPGSGFPGGQGGQRIVRGAAGRLSAGARSRRRRGRGHRLDRLAEAGQLAVQTRALGLVPRSFPGDRLGFAGDGAFRLFGAPTLGGQSGLVRSSRIERGARRGRGGAARRHGTLQLPELRLGAFQVRVEASVLRPSLQHGIRRPQRDPGVIDDSRAVPHDRHPAGRQRRLDREAGRKVRHPHGPGEQAPYPTGRVPPDGLGQPPAAGRGDRIEAAARRRIGDRDLAGQPFLDQEPAAFGGKVRDPGGRDEIRASPVREHGLDGSPQRRIDGEILVQAPATGLARRARDRSALFLGEVVSQGFRPSAEPCDRRGGRRGAVGRRGPLRLGGLERRPRRLSGRLGSRFGG